MAIPLRLFRPIECGKIPDGLVNPMVARRIFAKFLMKTVAKLACVTFLLAATAQADSISTDELSKVVGYTVLAVTHARGSFDGADYDKAIALDNGWVFEFREYGYSYAFRPEVVIFVKGSQYKLLINGQVYDAVPFGQIPGTGYRDVQSGSASPMDLILGTGNLHGGTPAQPATVHRETREEKADREFNERLDKAKAKHPDFTAVINRPEFAPTPAMRSEIFKSSVGLELAYWLATHAEQYREIALLPMDSAIRELRKIEMTLR